MIKDQLALSLRQGLLLGDLVYRATGDDLHVTRFPEDHLFSSAEEPGYRLLHRTIASYAGLKLGSAETYWSGSRDAWSAVAGIRMRHLLHDLGYEVCIFFFDRKKWLVRRGLRSIAPGGSLVIIEIFLLEPMSRLGLAGTKTATSRTGDA